MDRVRLTLYIIVGVWVSNAIITAYLIAVCWFLCLDQ